MFSATRKKPATRERELVSEVEASPKDHGLKVLPDLGMRGPLLVVCAALIVMIVGFYAPRVTPKEVAYPGDPARIERAETADLPIPVWCVNPVEGFAPIRNCPAWQAPPALPGVPQPKQMSPSQFNARDLGLRLGFDTASSILRVFAILCVAGAVGCVFGTLRGAEGDGSPGREGSAWGHVVIIFIGAVIGGVIGLYFSGLGGLNELIQGPLRFSGSAKIGEANLLGRNSFSTAASWNAALGFGASGAVLCLFTVIAGSRRDVEYRLSALQVALLLGAALFSASSYANSQAAEWAKGLLDPVAMKEAFGAIDRAVLFWAALGSMFLVAVAGATYFAVTWGAASLAGDTNGQVLALKTADNKDFKFFGWLVNMLLALSPVWSAFTGMKIQPF